MKKRFLLFFAVLCIGAAYGQTTSPAIIKVRVVNEAKLPLEAATVELLESQDSSLIKTALTDKGGNAELFVSKQGLLIVRATAVNYSAAYSAPFEIENGVVKDVPLLQLSVAGTALQNVTISAKKPFIQKLTDRIVVNVEGSLVSAGSSVLDILERSPGITLDQNDNVSLRGRSGVLIMIDGKATPLSGADLASYLRGLPANAIESIHLITNPSAKYDAAGTSGIIDIRLKKDQRLGTNGSFTSGYGQGVYPKANAGLTFNYRNKKLNLFGNYNFNYRYNFNHLLIHWDFFENGVTTGGFEQDFYNRSPVKIHSPRIGLDYSLNKRTLIGAVVTGSLITSNRNNDNQNIILDQYMAPSYMTKTNTSAGGTNKNALFNLNIRHTIDSTGRELTADADLGFFRNTNASEFTTRYLNMSGSKLRPNYLLASDQATDLSIKSAKADYVHPLTQMARLEAGIKTSFIHADNDLRFFEEANGSMINDPRRTNRFVYEEGNHAAYANFKKEFSKYDFQVGLRAEYTQLKGHQVVSNNRFDSSYLQLFPSAFFNYRWKQDITLGTSVSRRIFRPGYSSLNPFVYYTDPSLYNTGNPTLKPEFSWLYELSYTHKKLNITAGYSYTQNIITGLVQQTDTNSRVNFEMPQNLSSLKQYDLVVSVPIKLAAWWNIQNNLTIYYGKYDGNVMNTVIDNGRVTVTANVNNSFSFKKGWSAEVNGRYLSPRQASLMLLKTQWSVAAGVQKNIINGKGTIRLNVTDIFWTALPNAVTNWSSSRETWHAYRDSRVANLTFTYRFGNNKVQAARKRSTASEEERRRAEG